MRDSYVILFVAPEVLKETVITFISEKTCCALLD